MYIYIYFYTYVYKSYPLSIIYFMAYFAFAMAISCFVTIVFIVT